MLIHTLSNFLVISLFLFPLYPLLLLTLDPRNLASENGENNCVSEIRFNVDNSGIIQKTVPSGFNLQCI